MRGAVLITALVALPVVAHAACPPLTGSGSPLERLARGDRSVAPVVVRPTSGPAPLTVTLQWLHHPLASPTRIAIDADGDGRPEVTARDYLGLIDFRHTYQQVGQYRFEVAVDGAGRPVRVSTPVHVVTAADFDQDLQSRWATFKAALGRGDTAAALECLSSRARPRLADALKALTPDFRRDIDAILTTIRFVSHSGEGASYDMRRPDAQGRELSFHVQFIIDSDGVWRLDAF